ncbi:YbhB/YbcL family Raf kinase inhibitor-like protein [Candidatus Giovannonibacteria bacterium]|nr:YbhB/YbcL family Raf kinase inhibitor-like protein [Candidatus Giovannonibacteria bacterium]
MKIESTSFAHNGEIPTAYTCQGENVSPALIFSDVPESAKSLALIVDDPDAVHPIWTHWTIFNMDPKTPGIPEGEIPDKATEGITSFGKIGYGGPCPPSGKHRYFFKLYALDKILDLDKNALKEDIEKEMSGHILASAELMGLYQKI